MGQLQARTGGHLHALPVTTDPVEGILNRTWRPALAVTGAAGLPIDRFGGQRAASEDDVQAQHAHTTDRRRRRRRRGRCSRR